MKTQEKIELVEELIKNLKLKDKHESALTEIFGSGYFDSPFMNSAWTVEDFALQQVAARIGDDGEWLSWYVHECKCGEEPMQASNGDENEELRLIDSVEKLVELIEGAG